MFIRGWLFSEVTLGVCTVVICSSTGHRLPILCICQGSVRLSVVRCFRHAPKGFGDGVLLSTVTYLLTFLRRFVPFLFYHHNKTKKWPVGTTYILRCQKTATCLLLEAWNINDVFRIRKLIDTLISFVIILSVMFFKKSSITQHLNNSHFECYWSPSHHIYLNYWVQPNPIFSYFTISLTACSIQDFDQPYTHVFNIILFCTTYQHFYFSDARITWNIYRYSLLAVCYT